MVDSKSILSYRFYRHGDSSPCALPSETWNSKKGPLANDSCCATSSVFLPKRSHLRLPDMIGWFWSNPNWKKQNSKSVEWVGAGGGGVDLIFAKKKVVLSYVQQDSHQSLQHSNYVYFIDLSRKRGLTTLINPLWVSKDKDALHRLCSYWKPMNDDSRWFSVCQKSWRKISIN